MSKYALFVVFLSLTTFFQCSIYFFLILCYFISGYIKKNIEEKTNEKRKKK